MKVYQSKNPNFCSMKTNIKIYNRTSKHVRRKLRYRRILFIHLLLTRINRFLVDKGTVAEYCCLCNSQSKKRGGRRDFLSTLCIVSASKALVFLLFFL